MYSEDVSSIALEKLKEGLSVKKISVELNISKTTIYNWKHDYLKEISKEIKAIMQEDLEKALEICEQERFLKDETIQSQRIKILINLGRLEEALKISEQKILLKDGPIQSQRISILIKLGRLEEALKISEQNRFLEDEAIQSQRITMLMKSDRLEEALKISEQEIFKNVLIIQSQRMSILMKLGKLEEALKIGEQEELLKEVIIQSKRTKILMRIGNLEEALKISGQEIFKNVLIIQSQRMSILIKFGRLEEALKISEQEQFLENGAIQAQRISILIKLGRLEEALKISEQEQFLENEIIQSQKISILKLKNSNYLPFDKKEEMHKNINTKVGNLLTRIYWGDITLEELDNLEIDQFERTLLKIAYYEKYNKKSGIKFIKEQKSLYANDREKLKILNILIERLTNNKALIFDASIYENYLNCSFNYKLGMELAQATLNKEKQEQIIIPVYSKKKVVKNETKTPIKVKITQNENISTKAKKIETVSFKKKNIKEKVKHNKEILIKNLFEIEVLKIGAYLYLQTRNFEIRKLAIEALDNFLLLIEKPVTDKEALKRMIMLLGKVKNDDYFNFELDEKRYSKYIK